MPDVKNQENDIEMEVIKQNSSNKKISSQSDVHKANREEPKRDLEAQTQAAASNEAKPWWWQPLGMFILIGAIIGGSSIGVLSNFVPVTGSFAKNAWRSGLLAAAFAVPSYIEYRYKRHEIDYSQMLNFKQYAFLLLTLLAQVIWQIGLIYASLNTI